MKRDHYILSSTGTICSPSARPVIYDIIATALPSRLIDNPKFDGIAGPYITAMFPGEEVPVQIPLANGLLRREFMRIMVEGLRYATIRDQFADGLSPYAHQLETLDFYGKQYTSKKTMCIENASVTGSGKTLANFAAAILDDTRTCGIYPTNELLLDQYVSIQKHLSDKEILVLDSEGLDDIMTQQAHMRSHAHVLAWATGDDMRTAVLTNPDVLYLAMYNLYGQMFSTFAKSYGAADFSGYA